MAKKSEQQDSDKDLNGQDGNEQAPEAEEEETSADEQLRTELAQAQEEAKTHQEQYLRTLADMENLRKRTQREKEDLAKFANENILREILPVIDNLERAVEHADQGDNGDGLLEGVQMTLTQFSQVLTKFGVEPIESLGEQFDPAFHQAMGQLESADQPPNTVVQQMQKGYHLNERLLRPAFVMVAKAPAEPAPEEDKTEENNESETDQQSNDS